MAIPKPIKRYTVQDYYELERVATYKSDYYKGEIFAMAGGTLPHSRICANVSREIGLRLKGTDCTEYQSDLRLKIKATGLRMYPDVSVYCGTPEKDFEDRSEETFVNPTVLFEVLSPSTEAYDRGFKAENFRHIDSLKAYVLISQDKAHVELFERQPDGSWRLTDFRGLDAVVPIRAIGVDLPLVEIYDKVDFTSQEPEGSTDSPS